MCAFKWRHILVNAAAHMHVWSNFPRVLLEKRQVEGGYCKNCVVKIAAHLVFETQFFFFLSAS